MTAPPPLPREHGAWVMLALPLIFGLAIAWRSPSAWLVAAAALLAFLAHYALVPALQRRRSGKAAPEAWFRARWTWGGVYLVVAGLAFGGAIALAPATTRTTAVTLAMISAGCAAVYFAAAAFGEGRALWSEVVGMAGMALVAAMVAATAGPPDVRAWSAVSIAYAYSLSSLSYVRAYGELRERRRAATLRCVAAHLALAVGLLILFLMQVVSGWAIAAMAPVALRTVAGLIRPAANLRALGMRELWVAMALVVAEVAVLVRLVG